MRIPKIGIRDACKEHGGINVSFKNHDTWFKVVLIKTRAVKKRIKSSQKILEIISGNLNVTTEVIADMFDISRCTVSKLIAYHQSFNRLRCVGPDNVGYWEIM